MALTSNFVVAVTVKRLEQLQLLRQELQAIREMGGTGGGIKVQLDTTQLGPAIQKAKGQLQDVMSPTGTSGSGKSQSTSELTRAIKDLTVLLRQSSGPGHVPATATQIAASVGAGGGGRGDIETRGNKALASIKTRMGKLRQMYAELEEVTDDSPGLQRIDQRMGRLEQHALKVQSIMRSTRGSKSVTVPVGGSSPSIGVAAVTFDMKPMENTLASLSKMIQDRIVTPLAKLADIDFSAMVQHIQQAAAGAAHAGTGPGSGAPEVVVAGGAPGVAGGAGGRRRRQSGTPVLDAGGLFSEEQFERYSQRRAKSSQKQAQQFKNALQGNKDNASTASSETVQAVRDLGARGLLYIRGGLPFTQTSKRGSVSDLVQAEVVRRIRKTAGAAAPPNREDIQSFPPRADEGAAGRMLFGDAAVLKQLEARLAEYQQSMANGDPVMFRRGTTPAVTPLAKFWTNYGEEYNAINKQYETEKKALQDKQLRESERASYVRRGVPGVRRGVEQRLDGPRVAYYGDFGMFGSSDADVSRTRIDASTGTAEANPRASRRVIIDPETGEPATTKARAQAIYEQMYQAAGGETEPSEPRTPEQLHQLKQAQWSEQFALEQKYAPYWQAFATEARRNLGATNAMPYTPGKLVQFTGTDADQEKRAQQLVEKEFGLAPGTLGLLQSRITLGTHDEALQGEDAGQTIAPNRLTPAKVKRMKASQYRSLYHLSQVGDLSGGDALPPSLATSSLKGIYEILHDKKSPVKDLLTQIESGKTVDKEVIGKASAHMGRLLTAFPFLKNFVGEENTTAHGIQYSAGRLADVESSINDALSLDKGINGLRGVMKQAPTEQSIASARRWLESAVAKHKDTIESPDTDPKARNKAQGSVMAAYSNYLESLPSTEELTATVKRVGELEAALSTVRPLSELEKSGRGFKGIPEADLTPEQLMDTATPRKGPLWTPVGDTPQEQARDRRLEAQRARALRVPKNRSRPTRTGQYMEGYDLGTTYLAEAPYHSLKDELDRLQGVLGEIGGTAPGSARLAEAVAAAKALPSAAPAEVIAEAQKQAGTVAAEAIAVNAAKMPQGEISGNCCDRIVNELRLILEAIRAGGLGGAKGQAVYGMSSLTPEEREARNALQARSMDLREQDRPLHEARLELRAREQALREAREGRMASGQDAEGSRRAEQEALASAQLAMSGQALQGVGTGSIRSITSELYTQMNKMAGMQASILQLENIRRIRENRGLPTAGIDRRTGTANESLLAQYGTVNRLVDTAYAANPNVYSAIGPQVLAYRGAVSQRVDAQKALDDLRANGGAGSEEEQRMVTVLEERVRVENQLASAMRSRAAGVVQTLRANEREMSFFERFHSTLRRVMLYSGASLMVYQIGGMIMNAVRQSIALESSLTRIQGILNAGPTMRNQLGVGALQAAQQYGVGIGDVTSTLQTFSQAGYQGPQAITATRQALAGVVGGGLEPQQANNLLIAIDHISNGQIKFEDILDRVARVESTHAISGGDLASSLQRVGSLAQQMQPNRLGMVDFADLVSGATTAIVERTRVSGDKAATGLQFMLSRLAEPQVGNALQNKYKINLGGNTPEEMRPLMDILSDVAAKYQKYQASGQTVKGAQLLETVAGARQVNLAAALFTNWDDAMKTAIESSLAIGDVNRRTALQMETFSAKLAQTSAAFTGLISALLEKTGILSLAKSGLDATRGVMNAAAGHPDASMAATGALGLGGLIGVRKLAGVAGEAFRGTTIEATLATQTGWLKTISGIGKLFEFFAAIAEPVLIVVGTIGIIAGAIHMLKAAGDKARKYQETYGFTPFDSTAFQGTDTAKAYQAQANALGLSGQELYGKSAAAAYGVMNRFPTDMFRNANRLTKPGAYNKMREAFLQEMNARGVDFSAAGDKNAQIEAAIGVLRNSARYGNAPNQNQIDQFNTSTTTIGGTLATGLSNAIGGIAAEGVPLAQAPSFKRTLASLRPYGIKAGSPEDSAWQATQFGSAIQKVMLRASNSLVDFGATISTGAGKFGTAVDFIVSKMQGGDSLGAAMDKLAEQFYLLSASQEQQVAKATIRARLQLGSGADQDKVAALATTFLTPEVAARVGNNTNMRSRIKAALATSMNLSAREKAAAGVNEPISEGPGQKMVTVEMQQFHQAIGEMVDGLRKSGNPADEAQIKVLTAMLQEGNRNNVAAAIGTAGGKSMLRDRYMDAVIAYNTKEGGIAAQAGSYARIGLGFNAPQERLNNALQFVQTLGQIPAQIQGDLFKATYKMRHASDIQNTVSEIASGLTDDQGRPLISSEDLSNLRKYQKAGKIQVSKEDQANLTSTAAQLQVAANQIKNNKDVFSYMTGAEKAELMSVIANAGQTDLATLVYNVQTLYDIGERVAKQNADILHTRQQQTAEMEHQQRLAESHLSLVQSLAQISRTETARSAGILGSPYEQLQSQRGNLSADLLDANSRARLTYTNAVAAAELAQRQGTKGVNETDEAKAAALSTLIEANATALGEYQKGLAQLGSDYRLQVQQEFDRRRDQSVDSATGGLRSFASSYAEQHASTLRSATADIFGPVGQTAFANIGNAFTDALVGKEGLLRGPLEKLFQSPAQQEAEMIYNAHLTGIEDGFAAVGIGAKGAPIHSAAGKGAGTATYGLLGFLGGKRKAGVTKGSIGLGIPSGVFAGIAPGIGLAGSLVNLDAVANTAFGALGAPGIGLGGGPSTALSGLGSGSAGKDAAKKAIASFVGMEGGTLLGDFASPFHTGYNYASEGAGIGTLVGSVVPVVGPILGGVVGGLLGGLFGKTRPKPPVEISSLDRIERNTRETVTAIQNQTQLLSLDNRLLNVPTGFTVPSYRPLLVGAGAGAAGGVVQNVSVTITDSRDPQATATAVAQVLMDQSRRSGTFTTSRY